MSPAFSHSSSSKDQKLIIAFDSPSSHLITSGERFDNLLTAYMLCDKLCAGFAINNERFIESGFDAIEYTILNVLSEWHSNSPHRFENLMVIIPSEAPLRSGEATSFDPRSNS